MPKLNVDEKLQGRVIRCVAVFAAALVQRGSRQPSLVMDDAKRLETYIINGDRLDGEHL